MANKISNQRVLRAELPPQGPEWRAKEVDTLALACNYALKNELPADGGVQLLEQLGLTHVFPDKIPDEMLEPAYRRNRSGHMVRIDE